MQLYAEAYEQTEYTNETLGLFSLNSDLSFFVNFKLLMDT